MNVRPDEATLPPCASCPPLFESTDLYDHMQAKKICDACPMIEACADLLADVKLAYGYGYQYGPRGTWAGQLLAPKQPAAKTRAA